VAVVVVPVVVVTMIMLMIVVVIVIDTILTEVLFMVDGHGVGVAMADILQAEKILSCS
jgi:hypothetical protein